MIKVAIVGSQGKHWTSNQRTKVIKEIENILTNLSRVQGSIYQAQQKLPMVANPGLRGKTLVILVSGGCGATGEDDKFKFHPGVDGWAEIVADSMGIEKDIRYAPAMQWSNQPITIRHSNHPEDPNAWEERVIRKGFKTRNLEIAKTCDILYCIDPKGRRSGGQWTLERAKEMGKEVHLVEIE